MDGTTKDNYNPPSKFLSETASPEEKCPTWNDLKDIPDNTYSPDPTYDGRVLKNPNPEKLARSQKLIAALKLKRKNESS